jgi:hypothetical protein
MIFRPKPHPFTDIGNQDQSRKRKIEINVWTYNVKPLNSLRTTKKLIPKKSSFI